MMLFPLSETPTGRHYGFHQHAVLLTLVSEMKLLLFHHRFHFGVAFLLAGLPLRLLLSKLGYFRVTRELFHGVFRLWGLNAW